MRNKTIIKSKYKGVKKVHTQDNKPWMMSFTIEGRNCVCRYETELQAAKAYDIAMIRNNKKPVNVIRPK